MIQELAQDKKRQIETKRVELNNLSICPQNRIKRADLKLEIEQLLDEVDQIKSGISPASYYSSLNKVLTLSKEELEKQIQNIGLTPDDLPSPIDPKTGKPKPKKRRTSLEESPAATKKQKILQDTTNFFNTLLQDGEIEDFCEPEQQGTLKKKLTERQKTQKVSPYCCRSISVRQLLKKVSANTAQYVQEMSF